MSKRRRPQQPKVRSKVARDAWFQTGGGTHGGSPKQTNKRQRRNIKSDLRSNPYV